MMCGDQRMWMASAQPDRQLRQCATQGSSAAGKGGNTALRCTPAFTAGELPRPQQGPAALDCGAPAHGCLGKQDPPASRGRRAPCRRRISRLCASSCSLSAVFSIWSAQARAGREAGGRALVHPTARRPSPQHLPPQFYTLASHVHAMLGGKGDGEAQLRHCGRGPTPKQCAMGWGGQRPLGPQSSRRHLQRRGAQQKQRPGLAGSQGGAGQTGQNLVPDRQCRPAAAACGQGRWAQKEATGQERPKKGAWGSRAEEGQSRRLLASFKGTARRTRGFREDPRCWRGLLGLHKTPAAAQERPKGGSAQWRVDSGPPSGPPPHPRPGG